MVEFAHQIAEKWNISPALSEAVCTAFRKGDSPYYLAEYNPAVAVELSISCLWEIYDFLAGLADLDVKKKRVLNALKKADKLTTAIEKRVNMTANPFDLEDLILPLRPNPRSRGRLAAAKGLEPLADVIARQEEATVPLEALAAPYVGRDPSLASAADVLSGVKDLLAERFAYDDTVRAMVRDFAYDDGYFDVAVKNKQDPLYARFAGKQLLIRELTKEDVLSLAAAEESKAVRARLGVQLFRITELLRHHFITNPDFAGFDLLCEIIDDCWMRLLQPIVERDVKIRLLKEAENWAAGLIAPEVEKRFADESRRGVVLFVDAGNPRSVLFLCVNGHGDLVGATSEKRLPDGRVSSPERLRQFFLRHRPSAVVVCDNDGAPAAEALLHEIAAVNTAEAAPPLSRFKPDPSSGDPADSAWVQERYATLLDGDARRLYGMALLSLQPVMLLPQIGPRYYTVHPLQAVVSAERFSCIVGRIVTDAALHKGIALKDIAESPLTSIEGVTPALLQAVRALDSKESIASKNGLLTVPGMTESVFRNIAGFLVVPAADDLRDRSLVHPDHYAWLEEACGQLNVSLETIMSDPEVLRSFAVEDFIMKAFIEKKLIAQMRAGLRSGASAFSRIKRKLKLTELKEGSVVAGRVTNITPFGVFVNINAVCDGLIHISQLADEYVETPDQVVALHDRVDVRIIKVDAKKRRISLSMKNLGRQGPRVRPTQGQLNTLAEHFNAR